LIPKSRFPGMAGAALTLPNRQDSIGVHLALKTQFEGVPRRFGRRGWFGTVRPLRVCGDLSS
jgi:hypothetical protein